MLKILQADKRYESNLKQYTRKDGILSFLLFGIIILNYSILAIFQTRFEFIKENIVLVGCIFNALMIVITILFIKLNKQNLNTIGISKGKWKNSIIIGIILASFLFYNNCLSHLVSGSNLISKQKIITLLVYYLLVAVCEEFVFRGYIGTRIFSWIIDLFITHLIFNFIYLKTNSLYGAIILHWMSNFAYSIILK